MMEKPTNLPEAIRFFSDLDVATDYVAGLRWPDGFVCPHCGGRDYSYVSTRRLWKCKSCQKQSSVKVGTIFADSALGLDKWLPAIWLTANPETGMSSHELARALGTTQKSAWLMLHRVGEAAVSSSPSPPPADVPAPAPTPIEVPAPAAQAADLPQPATEDRSGAPRPRLVPTRPAWFFAALALAFGLGAALGRLSNRIDRLSDRHRRRRLPWTFR